MSEKDKQDENQRRIAACLNAFENIPTTKIEGKNLREILAGELRLNNAGPRADGGFGFELSGGVCHLMAEGFAEQFKQSGAINYLELLFDHSDIGPLTITMQRVNGLTPAQKLAKAETERDGLQQKLDAVVAKGMELAQEAAHVYAEYNKQMAPDVVCDGQTIQEFHDLANGRSSVEAYLNSVRAEGIEILTDKLQQLIDEGTFDSKEIGVAAGAVHEGAQIAAQLRTAAPKGDSDEA